MIEILGFSIILGIWCAGLFVAAQDEMILSLPATWLESKLGFWAKPIITCAPCMPSVHFFILYYSLGAFNIISYTDYYLILSIPIACYNSSLLTMLNKYFVLINYEREDLIIKKHEFYNNE